MRDDYRYRGTGTGSRDSSGFTLGLLGVLVAWWGWMPLVYLGLWGFNKLVSPGIGTWHQDLHIFWVWLTASDAGVWGLSPWFWAWIGVGLVVSAVIVGFWADSNDISFKAAIAPVVVFALFGLGTLVPTIKGAFDSDKDEAYFYLQGTTLYLEDPSTPPSSLRLLFSQTEAAKTQNGDVLQIGDPTRVKKGSLPTNNWRKRNSSYDGAKRSLNQKTSVSQGVNVFDKTVTYVYGTNESNDGWSAVLDGSKYENPMVGVAEWRGGENVAHVCRFDTDPNGQYRFTRAFQGAHLNSLTNVLALEYPNLVYEDEDISGYCDSNDKPVILISVTRYVGWRASIKRVPAGVLVLRGSPSGHPAIEHKPVVEAGEFPVPVYPLSTARIQREQLKWLAGRGNMENANFGFEPSSFSSQAGNNGEYVLKSTVDGSMVALTPLTAQGSQSQLYINYTQIRVDSVHDGQLNPLNSYVLPDSAKAVDPQGLDSLAQQLVQRSPNHSNFINSGGKLKEYVPTGPNTFRGYGEDSNGATILYIDLSYDQKAKATVVTLDPDTGREIGTVQVSLDSSGPQTGTPSTPGSAGSTATCNGKDLKVATAAEIEACLRAYQDELLRRLQAQQATPAVSTTTSPTPAATK